MTVKQEVEECYLVMSEDKNFLLLRDYTYTVMQCNAMQRSIVASAYRVYRSLCLHRLSLPIPLIDSCRIPQQFVSLVVRIPLTPIFTSSVFLARSRTCRDPRLDAPTTRIAKYCR